ncbi:MAG: archaemetzincin family Zn-dependent metalloprotease [Gemmatimonadota bacterium]|nr:MAG: archaemetzincin family Zn-dependent metalloprotease [Gemmatimonadota bacterium]
MLHICLLPLSFPDHELLTELSSVLGEIFRIPVVISNKHFSLEDGKDYVRNQYNSTWILAQILEQFPEDSYKILGVTTVDLYVPVLTYVFGEAQLDGTAAVVSIHRLRDELYGLPKNPQKLQERLEKEAIHELGHTFGLIHCSQPQCVMYTSTYAEEIDFKPKYFCHSCLQELSAKSKK